MKKVEFEMRTPVIDLLQVLKATGFAATGGEGKMLVDDGMIQVNGEEELRRRRKLHPGDEVIIDEQVIIALKSISMEAK